jgi:hypothetical protein
MKISTDDDVDSDAPDVSILKQASSSSTDTTDSEQEQGWSMSKWGNSLSALNMSDYSDYAPVPGGVEFLAADNSALAKIATRASWIVNWFMLFAKLYVRRESLLLSPSIVIV